MLMELLYLQILSKMEPSNSLGQKGLACLGILVKGGWNGCLPVLRQACRQVRLLHRNGPIVITLSMMRVSVAGILIFMVV